MAVGQVKVQLSFVSRISPKVWPWVQHSGTDDQFFFDIEDTA